MTKKKRNLPETMTPIVIDAKPQETQEAFPELASCLKELSPMEGFLGYIIRSDTSAAFSLKDQKTTEYALLGSQVSAAAKEFRELFNLGALESTVVECQTLKVLCVEIDKCAINVFLDKTAGHEKFLALLKQQTA
jgi:predicted regulator of Ras-like GTPase activity (Roadblock/LC7/MglB family)